MDFYSVIERECPMCGQTHTMAITEKEFFTIELFLPMMNIQEALPDFNPAQREFVKTGYCQECQKQLFRSSFELGEDRYDIPVSQD